MIAYSHCRGSDDRTLKISSEEGLTKKKKIVKKRGGIAKGLKNFMVFVLHHRN